MDGQMQKRHDSIQASRTIGIGALIPVFLIAQVNPTLVNDFFEAANAGTSRHAFEEPQGSLITTDNSSDPAKGTTTPMPPGRLATCSSLGWSLDKVITYAQNHQRTGFSPHHLIILDQTTIDDKETAQLISLRAFPNPEKTGLHQHYQVVRADFESSIINLMAKEMAVGGDEHLDTNYEGFDGVLRNRVRDEWEKQEIELKKQERS